jgi:E3 ubiquitin-protein ligase ZNF598
MSGETAGRHPALAAPPSVPPGRGLQGRSSDGRVPSSIAPAVQTQEDSSAVSSENRSNHRKRGGRPRRGRKTAASAAAAVPSHTHDATTDPPPLESPAPGCIPLPTDLLNVAAPKFNPNGRGNHPPLEDPPAAHTRPRRPRSSAADSQPHAVVAPQENPRKKKAAKNKSEAAQGDAAATAQLASAGGDAKVASSAPHCLLCAEPMSLLSFGACNHRVACGRCCLRMRMCYHRTDCALCKMNLEEVVIAPWRPSLPEFEYFSNTPNASARSRPGQLGPGTVLVDKWQPGRRPPSTRLLHELERSTALACSACPPDRRKTFARAGHLENHVHQQHGLSICGMCLREQRCFPLDLPLFETPSELKTHVVSSHPRCEFCDQRFFDGDALFLHLQDRHFRCQLCEPVPGADHSWFRDAQALREHLREDHHACDDPTCVECLVAFATQEELRRHYLHRHSSRLTRWDPSNSRRLPLDIVYTRRTGDGEARGMTSHGDRGTTSRRRGGHRRGRVDGQHGVGGDGSHRGAHRPRGFELEMEGGYNVIDDDLGLMVDYTAAPAGHEAASSLPVSGRHYGRERRPGGSPWGTAPASQSEEQFPSLAVVAAAIVPAEGQAPSRSRLPPLVKHTVRCPCGRRVSYPVVEQGQPVPGIDCDAVCQLEGRRSALADAFGVENPDRHVSVFDRRPAVWSGALLAAAKQQRSFVEGVERELESFVADKSVRRRTLAPMTTAQRVVVHGMAEQYGFASASFGQEPRRCVELLKTPSSQPALPDRMLSRTAALMADEEIDALLAAADGHPIRFIEVAPTCDLRNFLGRWEGRFSMEWEGGSVAMVKFEREEDRNEAINTFGGGIRGLFLIDRQWRPRTGVAAVDPHGRGDAGRVTAPWSVSAGARGGEAEAGRGVDPTSWMAVAGREQTRPGGRSDAGEGEGRDDVLPKGWAVITAKRKSAKPRVA